MLTHMIISLTVAHAAGLVDWEARRGLEESAGHAARTRDENLEDAT